MWLWLRRLIGSAATREYLVAVHGESFANADGIGRQAILAETHPGAPVRLIREPDNPHDRHAIAVFASRGQIGYVDRSVCRWLAVRMDAGDDVSAHIYAVHGGEPGKPSRGAVLEIRIGRVDS